MNSLIPLRDQIDDLDQQLIDLIAKRSALVAKVGEVKSEKGFPVYIPSREQEMIQARRAEALKKGISPDLIEDLLRRIMHESYHNENKHGFKNINPAINKIVIVGGKGKLGGLFGEYFRLSGYKIEILEKDDWARAKEILANASMVLVAVPINLTIEILDKLQPFLRPEMLLADLTSIKEKPLNKMLEIHKGAVVGLHPMFGSDISTMAKQVIICTDGRNSENYAWLIEQFTIWGANIKKISATKHDEAMTFIQAVRHFYTFVAGLHLSTQNIEIEELLDLSSPIYRLELTMIGRLFSQDAGLYADIIFNKSENLEAIKNLYQSFGQALEFLQNNYKQGFIASFSEIRKWFKDYSDLFLKESQNLLQQVNYHKP